jgi:SAM-dependent MidA family methyltransferase
LNQVVEKIREEIQVHGPITFARFMEWALYCPVYGFYEKEEDTVGRGGHYYTSVSVGSAFGELLARQFAQWMDEVKGASGMQGAGVVIGAKGPAGLEVVGATRPLVLVEAGAHKGQLAWDILAWFQVWRPDVLERLVYWIVEPSARREAWQRRRLGDFKARVRWAKSLPELRASQGGVRGVIFSNELLDAMPVHRFGWDATRQSWFEWGVTIANDRLQWTRMGWDQRRFAAVFSYWPAEVLASLTDAFSIEVGEVANWWWREAGRTLETGKLLTIDYGSTADELVKKAGTGGTLRAYYRHQAISDVLVRPGEQDITSHVNFSTLRKEGEIAGLKTEALMTQEKFLTGIAAPTFEEQKGQEYWTAERIWQFKTLTNPEHLGRRFRVLVQSRGQ